MLGIGLRSVFQGRSIEMTEVAFYKIRYFPLPHFRKLALSPANRQSQNAFLAIILSNREKRNIGHDGIFRRHLASKHLTTTTRQAELDFVIPLNSPEIQLEQVLTNHHFIRRQQPG
jgi:hypothetical protein